MTRPSEPQILDRLATVFSEHPWLVDALREADYWLDDDGGVQLRCSVDRFDDAREGLEAFAAALDMPLERLGVSDPQPPCPARPPVRFSDLSGT